MIAAMTDPAVTIRPATRADVKTFIELVRLSMGDEVDWLFGREKGHPADDVLGALFCRKTNRLSYDTCHVACLDDRVAGLLIAYPGRNVHSLDLRTGMRLVGIIGLPGTLRLARIQSSYGDLVEAEPDEFYISNLAVSPAFQRQGIGAAMLVFAEKLAKEAGLTKCALIVALDNPARRLYERCGYALVHTYKINHPIIADGSGGFHRMVKHLGSLSGD